MKIALIAMHFAEYASLLALALARHHEVLLLINRENFKQEVSRVDVLKGVPNLQTEFIVQSRHPLEIIRQAMRIVWRLLRFQPEVIHLQETSKDSLALALPFLGSVPKMLTVHDPTPHAGEDSRLQLATRHGVYIRQIRRHADGILVHGDRLLANAKEVFPHLSDRISSVPHGPLGLLERPFTADWQPGNCLFFGRMEEYKGLSEFIDVIRSLRATGTKVKGVIAGRGVELTRLKPKIADDPGFEIRDRFLSPAEVVACFSAANVVVMPYREATQSGVAAYAMGMGRPVVATDVGAIREMLRHESTGLLVPQGDMSALAAAIARIVSDETEARRMSVNAKALAETEFSWAAIAEKSTESYVRLLARRGLATR